MTIGRQTRRDAGILGFGLAATAVSFAGVLDPDLFSVWLVRAVVLLQAMLTSYRMIWPSTDIRLVTPLFLLPMMAMLFFSVAPTVFSLTGALPPAPQAMYDRIITYSGSHSEFIVLQFIALCLLGAALLPDGPARKGLLDRLDHGRRRRAMTGCLSIAVLCAVTKFIDTHAVPLAELPLAGLGNLFRTALPPILYFCLAAALAISLRCGRRAVYAALAIGIGSLVLFVLSDLARLPLSFGAFALLMMCAMISLPPRKTVLLCAAIALAVGLLAAAAYSYRTAYIEQAAAAPGNPIVRAVATKLLHRQTVSGWCLEQARARHWDDAPRGRYLDFVSGLVPRALWPGKPNLSRGTDYAVTYCGAEINPEKPHSEALTLLAEPIIEGGLRGLLIGEALLLGFVGLLSVLMLRTGDIGIIAGTALLPWLTAFEEHLTYYLANCTKMLLIMLPFALALHWYAQRSRTKRT
mgnify:CR=1 FL=1